MKFFNKSIFYNILKTEVFGYKAPSNLNSWYNYGFLALIFLVVQVLTGLILAMHYKPELLLAHESIIHIQHNVYYGWFIRSLHANGASLLFLVVYIHMARGLYYCSFLFPRQKVWISGSLIWVLMIVTAFTGYILPWGQMSFWGAIVITNLLGALPLIGGDLIYLLWGGFTVGSTTLYRFYIIHVILPWIILILSYLHIYLVHSYGSSNPVVSSSKLDEVPFYPYYILKDLFYLFVVLSIIMALVFLNPDFLGHPDNYIKANPFFTPLHITPEWYFLPLYAVLRSIPNKLLGIFVLFMFISCIFLLPYICKGFIIKNTSYRPYYASLAIFLIVIFILLGWIGSCPVSTPFLQLGQLFTFLYFFIILVLFPLCGYFEKIIYIWYITKKKKKKILW